MWAPVLGSSWPASSQPRRAATRPPAWSPQTPPPCGQRHVHRLREDVTLMEFSGCSHTLRCALLCALNRTRSPRRASSACHLPSPPSALSALAPLPFPQAPLCLHLRAFGAPRTRVSLVVHTRTPVSFPPSFQGVPIPSDWTQTQPIPGNTPILEVVYQYGIRTVVRGRIPKGKTAHLFC